MTAPPHNPGEVGGTPRTDAARLVEQLTELADDADFNKDRKFGDFLKKVRNELVNISAKLATAEQERTAAIGERKHWQDLCQGQHDELGLLQAEAKADRAALENKVKHIVDLERETITLAARVAELEKWLAECFRLTGADPDGNEDWRLAPDAVEEVRRLRKYSDAAEARVEALEAGIGEAQKHHEKMRDNFRLGSESLYNYHDRQADYFATLLGE